MALTQVVTGLPPSIDGVGDYALNLARQLRKEFGIETHFIVGDPNWPSVAQIEQFLISQVPVQSATALFSLLSWHSQHSTVVLLHYVNYGYAKRGCPVWLIDGLQRWQNASTKRFLVTMFHELHAFGPPWTSSFWLSPMQRNLTIRLTALSDRCLTSRQGYAEILHKLGRGKHSVIPTIPVFSNIGEPQQVPPSLAERTRRLVVFGNRKVRLQVYQQCLTALEQLCQALEIIEICDIGVPTGMALVQINNVPVVEMGVAEATKISEILLDSVASFANFPPPEYLAKSTIFAAYCAHRMLPIMTTSSAVMVDGLRSGKHYWPADAQIGQLSLESGQAIADNAYAWYQSHRLSIQAEFFATHLTT